MKVTTEFHFLSLPEVIQIMICYLSKYRLILINGQRNTLPTLPRDDYVFWPLLYNYATPFKVIISESTV